MSRLLLTILLVSSACTSASAVGSEPPIHPSIRERLGHATQLVVLPATSGGALTARHWSRHGWIGGDVPLVITSGGVTAQADLHGQLEVASMRLALAPIDIPQDTAGVPIRLEHLELDLEQPIAATATKWTPLDDAATASSMARLQLSWAVTIDGTTTALTPQHLPPVPLAITVGGDHDTVDATLAFDLAGTVWGWAGLIDLRDLRLVVDSSTP